MPVRETTSEIIDRDVELHSLLPSRIFDVLDLSRDELEAVQTRFEAGDHAASLAALRDHFRRRIPRPADTAADPASLQTADRITRHIFQWGPYEEADYGDEVDWAWDPPGDIEWVAAVYRFYWARTLTAAYRGTGDERYARAFVELSQDWIHKHPLEEHRRTHAVYTDWHGFAWLDLQTGIRATNLCDAFRTFLHADAFSPEFLGVLLASLYDHQVKTRHLPMGVIHNKAVFEQRGFVAVAADFPEFADARAWLQLGLERARDNLLAQTTADGVQREWSFGYHMGVLRDAVEIERRLTESGVEVGSDYRERVRRMHDYVFGVATPDLASPMFGDGSRPRQAASMQRSRWPLHGFLVGASRYLGDPKYAALARLDRRQLPTLASCAFLEAGMYIMRSGWDTDAIYCALHCAPPAISGHDQPDNGTFELYAFGRWLMPDSGFYTYGHDPEGRAWHRRTAAHQTLTLDDADSAEAGRRLLWHSDESGDVLIVENEAYEGLLHRRTVWFPGRSFFVILDEAIGAAPGVLDLHFQLAPGPWRLEPEARRAFTAFADANVLVAAAGSTPVETVEEEGWWGWGYGEREQRPAFRFRHQRQAPAHFLTVVAPFRGNRPPEVSAVLSQGEGAALSADADAGPLIVTATCGSRRWELGRDLDTAAAFCRPAPARGRDP